MIPSGSLTAIPLQELRFLSAVLDDYRMLPRAERFFLNNTVTMSRLLSANCGAHLQPLR